MNPLLSRLQPYPFERLKQLFADVTPAPHYRPISLGIGEPRHATPQFIKDALCAHTDGLASYPATAGEPRLRAAFTDWLARRYGLQLDPATQVLPVNGSREALFAFAQTVIDASKGKGATEDAPIVVCPNPFYQIYEGAALLAGATPHYVPSRPERNFAVDWDSVPDAVWRRTQLVYVCSPGNPTGAVMPLAEWEKLFALSARHGFVIASDECYSEIYFQGEPPLGGLQAAARLGRSDFKNLMAFTSLSKRSNVPGLRSGFVAGDAELIRAFCSTAPTTAAPWGPRCRPRASPPGATSSTWSKTARCTGRSLPKSRRCSRRCWTCACPTRAFTSGLACLRRSASATQPSRVSCWLNTM